MNSSLLNGINLAYDLVENQFFRPDSEHPVRQIVFGVSVVGTFVGLFLWGKTLFHLESFAPFFRFIWDFMPIWAPYFLAHEYMHSWFHYIRSDFLAKEGSVLLEIKLPKETNKSPLAMEIFFTSLYQTGAATLIETYFKGKVRPWFSLELVSINGQVKFFIWTQPKYRNLIESQLYAQYPDVEIHESEDYSLKVPHDPDKIPIWGTYFKLTDPTVYPIKTYVDYGLDQDPKEEYKIDPMTSVLEYLGSLRRGEQVWIQIMIQAHRTVWFKEGHLHKKLDWKHEIEEEIEKIREENKVETDSEFPMMPILTKGQQEKIASLERSMSKFPFECAIRGFYIAEREAFDPARFSGLIGSFRQYSSNYSNGFKLGKFTDYDYKWQDFKRTRRNWLEKNMLEAYKRRSFFQPPFKFYRQEPFILTTEELATIYHFPGSVAKTPTLHRIPSKRVEAPANLPV